MKTLFDKFKTIVDNRLTSSYVADVGSIQNCKYIAYDKYAHDLKNEVDDEYMFLPFDYTAIEDKASLFFFIDEKPGQVGFECRRYFLEILTTRGSGIGFADDHIYKDDRKNMQKYDEIIILNRGIIGPIKNFGLQFVATGSLISFETINLTRMDLFQFDKKHPQDFFIEKALVNATAGLQEIADCNLTGLVEDRYGVYHQK